MVRLVLILMGFFLTTLWLTAANPTEGSPPVTVLQGDQHIRERVVWRDKRFQLKGNLFLHEGGKLILENATLEQMCTYTREFRYIFDGGTLITRKATIGGAFVNGSANQSVFELHHGTWEAENTTISYSSGIVMGWSGKPVKFHAKRLMQGPHPDSVIMSSGASDVRLEDSHFNISLYCSAHAGGKGSMDLPAEEPISRVFDKTNVPGVAYRLELVRTSVPLWWVFFGGIQQSGPPTEVIFGDCQRLIPCLMACDLRGRLSLPSPWPARPDEPATLNVGNLTLRTTGRPVSAWVWGLYLWGDQTDLTIAGQTWICELFLSGGRLVVEGAPGTFNSKNQCTTVEVGRVRTPMDIAKGCDAPPPTCKPVELIVRNATLGNSGESNGIIGQITAHSGGRISIEKSRCANLKLITKNDGTIHMNDVECTGTMTRLEQDGPITISDKPTVH